MEFTCLSDCGLSGASFWLWVASSLMVGAVAGGSGRLLRSGRALRLSWIFPEEVGKPSRSARFLSGLLLTIAALATLTFGGTVSALF